jgi:hypothetical protein
MQGKYMDLYYGPVDVSEIRQAVSTGEALRVDAEVWGAVDVRCGMDTVHRGAVTFRDPCKKCDSALKVRFRVTPASEPNRALKQVEYDVYYIRQLGGNPMPELGPVEDAARQEFVADMQRSIRQEGHDPARPDVARSVNEIAGEMPVLLLCTSMGAEYRTGALAEFRDSVDRLLYDRMSTAVPSAELLKSRMAEDTCARFAERLFPVRARQDVPVAEDGDRIAAKKLKAGNFRGAALRLEEVLSADETSDEAAANLYNLGVCREALGQFSAAARTYEKALSVAREQKEKDVAALAGKALGRMR